MYIVSETNTPEVDKLTPNFTPRFMAKGICAQFQLSTDQEHLSTKETATVGIVAYLVAYTHADHNAHC